MAEQYAVGHDEVESIFTKRELDGMPTEQTDLAFLFCGSGAARHVLSNLTNLLRWKAGENCKVGAHHHPQHTPAVLHENHEDTKTSGHKDTLTLVRTYTPAPQIIPPFINFPISCTCPKGPNLRSRRSCAIGNNSLLTATIAPPASGRRSGITIKWCESRDR